MLSSPGEPTRTDCIRILILDDNPADVELIQFGLQDAGLVFTSKVVTTEKDYIRELQEFSPNLILSDHDVPPYNGSLALEEAKRRCPDIPFILVTGAIREDDAIEFLTQGAKDYVMKARLEKRLATTVRRALVEADEHQARQQAEEAPRKAYRAAQERDELRAAERKAEMEERKKIEKALQISESRESSQAAELRRRAVESMKANKEVRAISTSEADSQTLLQELQIYQIELEMQNEELRQSNDRNDALLAKHFEIYDLSPIGHLTLNREGTIREANLTSSNLLGIERSRLIGQRFGFYVSDESRPVFNELFRKTFEGKTVEECVKLDNEGCPSRMVRLHARLSECGKDCYLSIIEITTL